MMDFKEALEHKIRLILLDNQGITFFDFFKNDYIIGCLLAGLPVLETLREMIDNGQVKRVTVKNDFRTMLTFKCEFLFYGDIEMICGDNTVVTWKSKNE